MGERYPEVLYEKGRDISSDISSDIRSDIKQGLRYYKDNRLGPTDGVSWGDKLPGAQALTWSRNSSRSPR